MGEFIKTNEKYGTGFEVNEHNGKISLIAAREADNGKVYQKWGDIDTGKDKKTRLPVAVELGEPEEAIQVLQEAIDLIRETYIGAPSSQPSDDEGDIPF